MSTEYVENIAEPEKKIQVPISKKVTGDSLDFEVDDYISKFLDMSNEAKDNDAKEKIMPLKEGLKTFPKAAVWSIILSSAIIMEGYDTNLLSSFYAFPAFAKKYGELDAASGTYEIPARWQTILSMCTNVGEVLGLYAAGIVADRIGYRKTLMGSLFLVICFIFILFFAKDVGMLAAGEILCGIPWGAFQTLTVSYASEVCPLVLRIYLTTYVNLCWVIGQLISSGVLKGLSGNSHAYAYQIPFAVQWVWPVPIMIGIYLAPESPWWLVRKGKDAQALKSIKRLLSENSHLPDKNIMAEAMLKKMQITVTTERLETKSTTYFDCFKGKNLRRTRIASVVWLIQNCCGSTLMGYSTYFYEQAGLSTSNAFTFSIIQYVLGICGTLGSWFASQKLGRFTIFFAGLAVNFVVLIVVGGLGCSDNKSASWGIGSLLLVFAFVYDLTVGPITYCLVAELPTSILRTKTVIIARNFYNISGIIIAIITPYMLNPTAWNWKAKTGFFWAGFSLAGMIWCWFELPETKGKTYAELDALFENRIPARKFRDTQIDIFDAGKMIEHIGEEGVKNFVDAKGGVFEEKREA